MSPNSARRINKPPMRVVNDKGRYHSRSSSRATVRSAPDQGVNAHLRHRDILGRHVGQGQATEANVQDVQASIQAVSSSGSRQPYLCALTRCGYENRDCYGRESKRPRKKQPANPHGVHDTRTWGLEPGSLARMRLERVCPKARSGSRAFAHRYIPVVYIRA